MDVSIIFVNYKTKDLTINAINSVIEKTEGVDYEIFVVDNASNDGSIEAIEQEFPNINIIKNPINSGFGSANNLAIKQAKGKYIFCLNTDTLLVNNAIKIMFDFMEKIENSKIGACGGYLVDKDLKPIHCGGRLPNVKEIIWKLGLRQIFKKYYNENMYISLNSDDENLDSKLGYITGADIFFRKSVLDKVGLFDENFFMYYEETDLCKRIWDSGYTIKFVPTAQIIHLEGASTKSSIKKLKMIKKSEFYYFKKHYPNQAGLVKLIYLILYLIDWLILGNKERKDLISFILRNCYDK